MLASQIWHCLDLGLLDGAEVLSEQLSASLPLSADARFLHGTVLLRQGMFVAADRAVAQFVDNHAGCTYVSAQSLMKQSRHTEAARLLERTRPMWTVAPEQRGISTAALWLLLGKCYRLNETSQQTAAMPLAQSAKLDPYLWENVELLVGTRGIDVRVDNLFSRFDNPFNDPFASANDAHASGSDSDLSLIVPPSRSSTSATVLPLTSTPRQRQTSGLLATGQVATPRRLETPIRHPAVVGTPPQGLMPPPPPLAPRPPRRQERAISLSFGRRSISNTFASSDASVSFSEGPSVSASLSESSTKGVFEILALIYKLVSRGRFLEAEKAIESLPPCHAKSPIALALAAKCALATARYQEAVERYRELLRVQPGRIKDMDLYSSTLWHLRAEQELATLAREKVTEYRDWPEAWSCMGNAFSVQEETAKAVECFQRAAQLRPTYAYAYALQGHEYMANEQLVDALEAFRVAIIIDPTVNNAWFGLGCVYLSLGDHGNAQTYMEQALKLNPENPIVVTYLGSVFAARGEQLQAMTQYVRACEMQPHAAFSRYKHAEALMDAGMYAEAVQELHELEELQPNETAVKFALGRALKELGDRQGATKAFMHALELDPKSAHIIKQEMEALNISCAA